MLKKTFFCILLLIPLVILADPINIPSELNDPRFILTNGNISFTLFSDINEILDLIQDTPTVTEESYFIHYNWNELEIITFTDSSEIWYVNSTSSSFHTLAGIGIGDSREKLFEINGQPENYNSNENLLYYTIPIHDYGTYYTLSVTLQNDQIISLELDVSR